MWWLLIFTNVMQSNWVFELLSKQNRDHGNCVLKKKRSSFSCFLVVPTLFSSVDLVLPYTVKSCAVSQGESVHSKWMSVKKTRMGQTTSRWVYSCYSCAFDPRHIDLFYFVGVHFRKLYISTQCRWSLICIRHVCPTIYLKLSNCWIKMFLQHLLTQQMVGRWVFLVHQSYLLISQQKANNFHEQTAITLGSYAWKCSNGEGTDCWVKIKQLIEIPQLSVCNLLF